jgi:predicted lipid-binding transport protein (Tim44 family)
MIYSSKIVKRTALALSAFAILSFTMPSFVEAKPSGSKSSGSRGSNSGQSVPNTPTQQSAPRTQQQGAPATSAARAPEAAKPSFMNRFGGMIAGGLLGAGLFSLLSGGGLGGMGGMLMGLLQIALIGGLIFLAIRFFRKKQEPAMAGVPNGMAYQAPDQQSYNAPVAPPVRERKDDVGVSGEDYNSFEQILTKVQDAYGREALGELKTLTASEIYTDFAADIAENTRQGVHNQCGGAKLLQGDLAESWSEQGKDYATVTMKYSLYDVTKNRNTGAIIEGSMSTPMEVLEAWTFVRATNAGQTWVLSGIDQI